MLFLCVRVGRIAKAKNGIVRNCGHTGGGMAYFYRVGLLLCVGFLFSDGANAASCTVAPCYAYTVPNVSGQFPTAVAACTAEAAYRDSVNPGQTRSNITAGADCRADVSAGGGFYPNLRVSDYYAISVPPDVPPPPVAPTVASSGACVTVCYNGSCSADPSCGSSLVGPNGSTPNTPNDCAAGFAFGSVNGLNVCVKPDFTSSMKLSSSTSSVSTDSGVTPSPSTIRSTETTTCTSYQCKTDTTSSSTPSGGGAPTVSTQSKLEPKEDFCTKNPRAATCITSAAGGSCQSGFTCDGDAIQCSIARTAFATNCAFTAPSSEADLYGSSKRSGNQTSDLPGNSSVSIGSGSFDQSNALGVAASCISDLHIVVMSRPVVLPFSTVCQYFETMGNILLACSLILAARIVSRG